MKAVIALTTSFVLLLTFRYVILHTFELHSLIAYPTAASVSTVNDEGN